MATVPHTLLNYNYWQDMDKNIRISDHFAAKYVESNYQYQCYLRCLAGWGLDAKLLAAQPDPAVWGIASLTAEEQAFLRENYWTAKEFEHYPVVGLGYEQVGRYLAWKTNMRAISRRRRTVQRFWHELRTRQ